MKALFILGIFLFLSAQANYIKGGYDISFGVFGKIGQAEITYTRNDDDYIILVHAWTIGTPAVLTQNRTETFISQGKVVNGSLRPDVFLKYRHSDRRTQYKLYLFDHKLKSIQEVHSKEIEVVRTRFDISNMKTIKYLDNESSFSKEKFKLYTDNDLLSLFFNTQKILQTLKDGDVKEFSAVGSKTQDCIVNIEIPTGEKKKTLEALMPRGKGKKAKIVTIIIHQDIFKSKKGELHVIFDKDGLAKNILLKDVIMFGDIKGKRTYLEKN